MTPAEKAEVTPPGDGHYRPLDNSMTPPAPRCRCWWDGVHCPHCGSDRPLLVAADPESRQALAHMDVCHRTAAPAVPEYARVCPEDCEEAWDTCSWCGCYHCAVHRCPLEDEASIEEAGSA